MPLHWPLYFNIIATFITYFWPYDFILTLSLGDQKPSLENPFHTYVQDLGLYLGHSQHMTYTSMISLLRISSWHSFNIGILSYDDTLYIWIIILGGNNNFTKKIYDLIFITLGLRLKHSLTLSKFNLWCYAWTYRHRFRTH